MIGKLHDPSASYADADDASGDQSMLFETTSSPLAPEAPDRFTSIAFWDWLQTIQPRDEQPSLKATTSPSVCDRPLKVERPIDRAINEILSPISPLRYQSLGDFDCFNQSSIQNQSKLIVPSTPLFSVVDDRFLDESLNRTDITPSKFNQPLQYQSQSIYSNVSSETSSLFSNALNQSMYGHSVTSASNSKRRMSDETVRSIPRSISPSSFPTDQELISTYKATVPEIEVLLKASDRLALRMEQAINRAISQSTKPNSSNICDWIFSIGMLFEWVPQQLCERFLRALRYTQHPIHFSHDQSVPDINQQGAKRPRTVSDGSAAQPAVWIPTLPFLPRVTLPLSFRTDWSGSSVSALPDVPNTINMATLVWERPSSVKLFQANNSFFAVPEDAQGNLYDSLVDIWRPVEFSDIDLSYCRLPLTVQVNAAFESLFGISQLQVRGLYMTYGTRAWQHFCEPSSMESTRPKFMQSAVEGHAELTRTMRIKTRKGLLDAIMLQKLHSDNIDDTTSKVTYAWFPMPNV